MTRNSFPQSQNFIKSPLWFRFLNKGWEYSYPLGTTIRLEKDILIKKARKATGLTDLGSDFNDGPLEKLLWSINHEAGLHPVGRFITLERFASLLAIRLRANDFFKKYPEILEQELYPAWIIVGLQRTGTTKLQRLLACDPDHRVIPSWEVINPIPMDPRLYGNINPAGATGISPSSVKKHGLANHYNTGSSSAHANGTPYPHPKDKRVAIANQSITAMKYISPGFFSVHPLEAMQPEEDILLLDLSFMSTTPEAMMPVPTYASWLEQTDQSEAYAYGAKILRFLQWINPAKRWVLKTPHHLEFPNLIEKHFGEVHFIWPHRSIYESVPSFLSMATYNHQVFCRDTDPEKVARHWVRKTGYMLDRALNYRLKAENDKRFTDVWYPDLIRDSMKEVSKIYALNGGLTGELVQKFADHERMHPHRKYGTHHYKISDFGLTNKDIDQHTRHYEDFLNMKYP